MNDAAYIVGYSSVGFMTTPGTLQPGRDFSTLPVGYILKLDSTGKIVYATYLGKDGEGANAVAVDAAGNAYFSVNAQSASACGVSRSTLSVLNGDASHILASAVLHSPVNAIQLDDNDLVYVAGDALTTTAYLTTPGAFLPQYPFDHDGAGFAAKIDFSRPAAPEMVCLVNAATFTLGRNSFGADGSVAPGELVTLFLRDFLPGPDLRVTFDGKAAPILYVDSAQINAVVPFGVGAGNRSTVVSVLSGTQAIGPYTVPVADAAPGLFTITIGGVTQVAALNQDGSLNSAADPAAPGSIISVFLTGAGTYDQKISDGDIGPLLPPYPAPLLGVGASVFSPLTLQSQPAQIVFAGQAPGLIAGVMQVNMRIPDSLKSGQAGITVYVGNYSTPRPGFVQIR